MASLLISGPAGSGKSAVARQLRAAAQDETIIIDFQSLYASYLGLQRDPVTRRYAEREDADAFVLSLAEYERRTLITAAVARGIDILATNSDGSQERRDFLLGLLGAGATERIEDPGIETVRQRLAVNGIVSPQCERALQRWYGSMREQRTVEVRRVASDLVACLIQEGTPATGGRREVFTNGSIIWQDGVDILT